VDDREQLQRDYANVFGSSEGKRVLADLNRFCGVDALGFYADCMHRTSFMAGARGVGLYVRDMLTPRESAQVEAESGEVIDER
jgi:hypothetical protein